MILYVHEESLSRNFHFIYLLKIGINANGDKPLSRRLLEDMNIGQLQVIVNDLHCQIESKFDYAIIPMEKLFLRS